MTQRADPTIEGIPRYYLLVSLQNHQTNKQPTKTEIHEEHRLMQSVREGEMNRREQREEDGEQISGSIRQVLVNRRSGRADTLSAVRARGTAVGVDHARRTTRQTELAHVVVAVGARSRATIVGRAQTATRSWRADTFVAKAAAIKSPTIH